MSRGRSRGRNRAATGFRGGASYDADAQAYITATGELFPDALNTLVLGIKAAGLWDNHVGSIKKAIGVPSLSASMIDLRTPSFTGTAVNTPGHSATAGWTFTAASSQYVDTGWQCGAANSKGSQDSVHFGLRLRSGGGLTIGCMVVNADGGTPNRLGLDQQQDGYQSSGFNGGTLATFSNPIAPGALVGSRTASNAYAYYKNGSSLGSGSSASTGVAALNMLIGCRNLAGTPDQFNTLRATLFHAGAGLDATQAAALTALFDAYATAAGEA